MSRRRADGEGSVFRYRNGWGGQVDVQSWNEPRRRKTVYGATRAEVLAKLDAIRAQTQLGVPMPAGRALSTGDYLLQWLNDILPAEVAAGRLKASTVASYTDQTRRHILPALGAIPLTELSPRHIRGWVTAKLAEPTIRGRPLSARSVAYLHALLRNALGHAMRDELISRNAAKLVRPPTARPPAIKPLTADEARQLLATTSQDRLAALWLTLLTLGLRRGEALALQWDDIDLETQTVIVRRTLQRLHHYDEHGSATNALAVTSPKTNASNAMLPLPHGLTAALREHRQTQLRERLAADDWPRPEMVFTTPIGTWLDPDNISHRFQKLCSEAGIRRMRLHDLRHSSASLLLLQGVDPKTVQTLLRHTRFSTTADLYLHVQPELQRDAGERLERLFATGASNSA